MKVKVVHTVKAELSETEWRVLLEALLQFSNYDSMGSPLERDTALAMRSAILDTFPQAAQ